MHPAPVDVTFKQSASIRERRNLEFLWLELTNRCNLQCIHCYTESHPQSDGLDLLTARNYESIMSQAYALGCRKLQFIGGEPQLNPDFLQLLIKAKTIGFDFIEVFSNLTRLDDDTVRYAAGKGVCFATSVYSDDAPTHDAITKVRSSHARTIRNLKKLIDNGIETRAAIIVIDQDKAEIERTKYFLRRLGVRHVREGETREFGRGEKILSRRARLSGLCGHCWAGKLCVAPDGETYPCVLARQWPVGNVLESPLSEIIRGEPLDDMRQTIFDTVWLPKISMKSNDGGGRVGPTALTGSNDCPPSDYPPPEKSPDKSPDESPPPDTEPTPQCAPCPQSCVPDTTFPPCEPNPCPMSCGPFHVE